MKSHVLLIGWWLLVFQAAHAQVIITNDTSSPDPAAGLEVKFDGKGFLPPRMTTVQMLAIPSPPEGLLIYNTTIHGIVYRSNEGWKSMNGAHFLGEGYGGGIIFYLDATGQHGLIAAANDQPMLPWGCYPFSIPGTSTLWGTGQANTTTIVAGCLDMGAARECDELELNGYSDWYLPSRDELVEMYNQRDIIGNMVPSFYWSSSENDGGTAFSESFEWGYNYGRAKYDYCYVRAIRSF